MLLIAAVVLTGGTNFLKTSGVEESAQAGKAELDARIAAAIKEVHELHDEQEPFRKQITADINAIKIKLGLPVVTSTPNPSPSPSPTP